MAQYIKTEEGYKKLATFINDKMDKFDPVGIGSFSMNRKAGTVVGVNSHAEGDNTTASGDSSHAEGSYTTASGYSSHAEGNHTTASGDYSHAEGIDTTASGNCSHAEGNNTTASGSYSHAEGFRTVAKDGTSHAEGIETTAIGFSSHAEGGSTNAFSSVVTTTNPTTDSIITAWETKKFSVANGYYSHVEGKDNLALNDYSHAEGYQTTASGSYSHAEGFYTKTSADCSHAEGTSTEASGNFSHAEGYHTIANGTNSHAQGKYNIEDTSSIYADIIGNGTSDDARSNAATVDWSGNAWFAGDVYTRSTSGTNKDDGSKKLATEEYVNSSIAAGGTDISLGLTSAAVGQTIKVKAVDESGKPTAWEAADMQSGGGSAVELDTTLTQSGQAADAKTVGDRLHSLSDEIVATYAKKTEVPTKTSQLTNDSGFLTSHQDISGKQDKSTLEADVAAKGFTKNTGTYSKPAGGIPKSDLAAAVQTSLGKADTALQSHQSLAAYRTAAAQDVIDSGKVAKVDGKGLSTNDYTDAAKAKVDAIPAVDTTLTVSGAAADANETGTRLNTLSGKIDNFIASGGFSAPIVDSVDEMIDTSKQYILKSTGTIWVYKSSTTEQEVTVTNELDDTTYYDGSRLGSSATSLTDGFNNDATGYHVTPLIDLTKAKYQGKTIQIHLDGSRYITNATETWIQHRYYLANGTVQYARGYSSPSDSGSMGAWKNATITINSETSATIEIAMPLLYGAASVQCGYLRFCGKGAVADSHIYITYKEMQTVTSEQWVDTGIQYGSGGLDAETAAKISELNNEGNSPSTIKLLPKPVLDFYNASAYSDSDYSYSHLEKITYPCRADIPVPYTVKWNYNENAMRTTVAVDTRAIGTVNAYTMKTYDATGLNKYPIYNLVPNKTYYYKVTHVLSDGSIVEAKSGSFTTSSEAWRLLYIDGTQNVRDLGGWTGLNGKKVKYGKIIRGAALNDSSLPELLLTGKGRRSLGELAIQAELNLGATDTETSIAANCVYKKIGYTNYAIAFTGETYRAQFKEVLEWTVDCLTASKPVYMHCQGGCDRTGTLSFQLLGLLGVSESDLAKEYELSSFSNIGFGRLRTTTKAVDTYDYVGMVEALKTYSGNTVTEKFYNFATTGCGISADTITNFRNLMLE